jgi:hypothetical protein
MYESQHGVQISFDKGPQRLFEGCSREARLKVATSVTLTAQIVVYRDSI